MNFYFVGMELCTQTYTDESRLKKLTNFQEKFLKHAMNSFPNAKRIVYSTCSVFPEENERVITNIVKASRAKWIVRDVKDLLKGQWNNCGSGMYGRMGTRCIYARPDTDFTTGFFVAVLDRELGEKQRIESKIIMQKNENDKIEHEDENAVKLDNHDKEDNNLSDEGKQISKKSKKKKLNHESNTEYETNSKLSQENINNEEDVLKSKKKKRKKNSENALDNESSPDENTFLNSEKSKELNLEDNVLNCKNKKRSKDIFNEVKPNKNVHRDDVTKISEVTYESKNVKSKKKKCKENENQILESISATFRNELNRNMNCDEVSPISDDTNEIPNDKKKKKKHKESENHILESVRESSENKLNGNISCDKKIEISEETNESQNLKKKEKKRKDNKKNTVEFIHKSVIDISTDMEKTTFEDNQLLKNKNEIHKLKTKRKKRKELDDETLEAVSRKVIDISSDAEEKTSKKGKKRKKCSLNESAIIEITDEEQMNNFDEVEIIESHELVDVKNNTAKSKKKKRKFREEEIEEVAVTIAADTLEYKEKGDKKSKKKKKEGDYSSINCDATQDVTKSKTKKSRENKSNFEDSTEITEDG